MKLVEKIKYQVPIKSVLSKLNIRKGANGYICPFHNDREGTLKISETENRFECERCGATGDQIEITKKIKGISFEKAIEFLAREFEIKEDETENMLSEWLSNRDKKPTLENIFGKETEGKVSKHDSKIYTYIINNNQLHHIHRTFLYKKGFHDDLIKAIGFVSIEKPHLFVEKLKEKFGIEALDNAGLLNRKREFVFQKNNLIIPFFEEGSIAFLAGWDIAGGKNEFTFPHHKGIKTFIPVIETKENIFITGDFKACFAFLKNGCFSIIPSQNNMEALLKFKNKKIFVCGEKNEMGNQFVRKVIKFLSEHGINYIIGGFEHCFEDYFDFILKKKS